MSLPADIAGQSIAAGSPMRVIAEIGLNHMGDADVAHRLVDACADAGAWAIKLQVFEADELLVADAPAPAHVQATSLREFFARFELQAAAYDSLLRHARERGLATIATAFDRASVEMLEQIGLDAFKVASADLTHALLIEQVARTGLPVILSTGMSTESDVWNAVDWAVGAGARSLALLHCVSAYPTPDAQQNLRAVATLAHEYKLPTGLSDHGMGADAALLAYAQGATLYERHVYLPGTDAIDAPVSSTPDDLRDIVRRLARAHDAMGEGRRGPMEAERANIVPSRRGLYARRAIVAGQVIEEADVAALRPVGSLGAEYARVLIGCRAPRDMAAGSPFEPLDLGTRRPGGLA
ncbi:Spore coat polysaccharide biosynthesis protein SpsE [Luteitalea pratensis]|uniref:Spore coat polysaccharide biosynthesis protein SpsE n=1 Tax=Luteitalea pratensis TaxID=1855912 RepID=A0A143PRF0_LUTPR|nr:N-acetylneuraminate synthase family protein [Luteitalea pratensis]AMY10394.1 Spore coat polysaccharide biosynthesis protein SpsE [Luteitalea pratensis]